MPQMLKTNIGATLISTLHGQEVKLKFKEIAKNCPWNDYGACSVKLFIDKRGKPHLRACKKKHCAPWYFVKGPCNTRMHMDAYCSIHGTKLRQNDGTYQICPGCIATHQ
jgi:hypothetical protein